MSLFASYLSMLCSSCKPKSVGLPTSGKNKFKHLWTTKIIHAPTHAASPQQIRPGTNAKALGNFGNVSAHIFVRTNFRPLFFFLI